MSAYGGFFGWRGLYPLGEGGLSRQSMAEAQRGGGSIPLGEGGRFFSNFFPKIHENFFWSDNGMESSDNTIQLTA